MQAEKQDHMKDALAARRGKGIDLIIGIAPHMDGSGMGHEMSDDDRKTESGRGDLAPPPQGKLESESPMAAESNPVAEHMAANPDHLDALQDADLIKGMSEHDRSDIAKRKPRSLMERARQMALAKK